MALVDALTLDVVRQLAGARTYARGKAYFHDGAVGLLDAGEQEVRASVQGTQRYRVRLAAGHGDDLEFECSCPVGDDGDFCKHAVAVALSWLENVGEEVFAPEDATSAKPRAKRRTYVDHIREYLATLDERVLREMLIDAADRDRGTRDKLLFAAKARAGKDLSSLRSVVRHATKVAGHVDWRDAGDYANRLSDLAQLLDQRIADGRPQLVALIEDAIAHAEEALGHVDDSNGVVVPAIMELREVHERACRALSPDQAALAERLFRLQTTGDWDTFHSILHGYREALGESGFARYRTLVEDAWKRLPALGPSASRTHFDSARFRIEHAMEELAASSGDIDALVKVKAHNLSSPYAFLELARLLLAHGRGDDALAWAEKGMAAFPKERLDDLRKFCIDEHLRRGDAGRTEALAWQRFVRQPGTDAYFDLVGVAKRIGRADDLAANALRHLWELVRAEEALQQKRPRSWQTSARGSLVAIHLRANDADRMWDAFSGGPVEIRLWDQVAAMRGKTHPEDAVRVYKQLLPGVVEAGTRGARYEEALAVVKAIQALRTGQRMDAMFAQELAELRAKWKAKRNFMKLLDTIV